MRLLLYTLFRQKEISGLLVKKLFKFVNSGDVRVNTRVFNLQFLDEIKNVNTDKAFKKLCFIM